jgi:flagellar export protein FliJ
VAKKGFRHHRLLDVRELLLELKSLALRKSEVKQRDQKEQLNKIQKQKKDHLEANGSSTDKRDEPISSRELQMQTWYTEQLNEDLRKQVYEVQVAEQEVQARREQVEKSAKDKKSLEKLKEYQDREARQEETREEQRHLDEIASRQRSEKGRTGRP